MGNATGVIGGRLSPGSVLDTLWDHEQVAVSLRLAFPQQQ